MADAHEHHGEHEHEHAHEHAADGPIVTFTDTARQQLVEYLTQHELLGQGAVRVAIQGRGPNGFDYAMGVEENGQPEPGDTVIDEGPFKVFIDEQSLPALTGAEVDYVAELMGGGFRIHNPNPLWTDPVAQAIQKMIDEQINPNVASHGGHVSMIDFQDDTVYVRMGGGCQGCGMVDVTLRQGIERLIKSEFPQVARVVDTTDHAGGSNPYYQPAKGGQSPYHQPAKG